MYQRDSRSKGRVRKRFGIYVTNAHIPHTYKYSNNTISEGFELPLISKW